MAVILRARLTEAATTTVAHVLASNLVPPLVLGFQGDLGAGKTTLIRAMLRALGVMDSIKSPTFSLIESYTLQDRIVHHFDLYRLSDETALDAIGFRDYLSDDAICCVEWPERAPNLKRYVDVMFSIKIIDMLKRLMTIEPLSVSGESLVRMLHDSVPSFEMSVV